MQNILDDGLELEHQMFLMHGRKELAKLGYNSQEEFATAIGLTLYQLQQLYRDTKSFLTIASDNQDLVNYKRACLECGSTVRLNGLFRFYTGLDGYARYIGRCSDCGRVVVLAGSKLCDFIHDDVSCAVHEYPVGMSLPRQFIESTGVTGYNSV